MKEEILKILSEDKYNTYGLRADSRKCEIGEVLPNSHQLYQDPWYTDGSMDELLYPYIEDGIYAGYYDAGELNGTSSIYVDERSIDSAIERIGHYDGKYIYLIGGDKSEGGNDLDESIIENAVVLFRIKADEI